MVKVDYYGYFEYIKVDMIWLSKYNFHTAVWETADEATF